MRFHRFYIPHFINTHDLTLSPGKSWVPLNIYVFVFKRNRRSNGGMDVVLDIHCFYHAKNAQ